MAEKKFLDAVGLSHVWNKIKSLYLPLSGGKMTATKAMSRDVDNSFLGLHGGTGENNDGAQLFLCGANHPDIPSGFQLHARNSTTDKILEGFTDGILKWNEKYVLSNAFSMPANTSGINLNSGTDYESGAYVRLYGKENTENAGNFVVAASDGSNLRKLEGNIDGSLKWNGNDVITAAGGTLNGNLVRDGLLATSSATGQSMWLTAGGGTTTGAGLWLYGSTATNKGYFRLRAHDGTNYVDLQGKPDGTLTWNGKSLLTQAQAVDYIVETYRNGTEWYEVYKSGKVRQGGEMGSSVKTVTLLKKMANTSYYCSPITIKYGGGWDPIAVTTRTVSSFTITTGSYGGCVWEVEGQGA